MSRGFRVFLVLFTVGALALVGCGSRNASSTSGSDAGSSSSSSAQAAGGDTSSASPDASGCPTVADGSFNKTKTVAHLAVAAGAFHQWILKPAMAGTFKKGAPHRATTILKGVAAAAFAKHELNVALDKAGNDPTFCKYSSKIKGFLSTLSAASLLNKIRNGSIGAGDLAGTDSTVTELEKGLGFGDVVPSHL
jgi:hypothetical protein